MVVDLELVQMREELAVDSNLSHYRIVSKVGAGGMGEVYLAHDTELDRQVALKVLPPEVATDQKRMNRFLQEAKAASALNHPNIVTIHEIQRTGEITFIALELIDGETLSFRIQEELTLIDLLNIAIQIAAALAAAHAAGILHRDIKPDNVMIRRDGIVKVLDFGLAKLVEPEPADPEAVTKFKTDAGVAVGTPVYMSPEQVCGKEVDARTDIFSLGVVIYKMVTGHLPFDGANAGEVMAAILSDKQPQPLARFSRDAPVELERIISKALRKDRDERYQTIKDFQLDLANLKQELEFAKRLERSRPSRDSTDKQDDAKPMLAGNRQSNVFSRRNLVLVAIPLVLVVAIVGYLATRRPAASDSITSLAVLPFVNIGNDPGAEYLSDGLADALINSLTQLDQLRVIARGTSFRYKGKDIDPQRLGRELNVQAVLTGSVRQFGDSLNIQVDLIDAASGRQLWGQEYERKNADVLSIKQAIAREVTDKLRLKLTREQQQRLVKHDAGSSQAYQSYLRGRFFWNKRTGDGLKRALEEFRQATESDPTYALGYVGLADTYLLLEDYAGTPESQVLPLARAAVDRALQLDESLPEAHTTSATIYDSEWRWEEAEREHKRAITLNPNYATAHHWYSTHLRNVGRMEEAFQEMLLAQKLDPLSAVIGGNVVSMHLIRNDVNAALAECRKVFEIDPDIPEVHALLGLIHLQQGRKAEAVASCEKAAELSGHSARLLSYLAFIYGQVGRRADALRVIKRLEEKYARREAVGSSLAIAWVGLPDKDQVFYWLEKDFQQRSALLPNVVWYPRLFDEVRSDPRFVDLIRRMNLPESALRR